MKKRILKVKLLLVGVAAMTLISQDIYSENSAADLILEVSAFVLLSIAAFGRTWSSVFISGKKNRALVTNGPYSIVRNPLYFFSFLGFLGAGLAFESFVIAAVFSLVYFLTHWPAILKEETKLTELFGSVYSNYKEQVPRFVPRPFLLSTPDTISLSPRIFSRALLESSCVPTIFIVAHVIEWAHINEVLPVVFKLY